VPCFVATQFEVEPPPSDALSALAFAPNDSKRLLVSSWDRHVYLYEINPDSSEGTRLLQKYEHRAPVLDVAFGASDQEAYTAGVDWQVTR
jgi:cell cycle arrest protein BUB3